MALSLLSNTSRVAVPFIKVTIGDYVFGVYMRSKKFVSGSDIFGQYKTNAVNYPNFVKSLEVDKVNGQVNMYQLVLEYTVRESDDPNFFEKVFGRVAKGRKIKFSYGDMSNPVYVYKEEEAIITKVKTNVDVVSNKLTYNVSAVSQSNLAQSLKHPYFERRFDKPSNVIRDIVFNRTDTGLLDLFYGMRNGDSINGEQLIPDNDLEVEILAKTNMSSLDYLKYLVSLMTPNSNVGNLTKGSVYILVISDEISNELAGPFFKIVQVDKDVEESSAYELTIGYHTKDAIISFGLDDDEGYSILYNYSKEVETADYVQRVNEKGQIEEVYAPLISSGNSLYRTTEEDKSWWTKITSYPIKASVTLKGLLRPSILMTHVRVRVLFFGKEHVSSGLYIITKQHDTVNEAGFKTTLYLLKIGGE